MINFGSLWIEVFTIERKPLDKARITTDKGAVAREDGPGRYIIEQLILGSVTLQVEADGLQAEKREIRIELGRNVAQFILGEPGLPAYKRRGIRVPFRPVEGLVGISVRGKEAAKQLEKRIGKLADLRPIATRDLFVIQVTPGRLAKLVAELRGLPDIAAVGPVMHLSERGIAFFSGNIMVRVVPGTKPEAVETLAQETNTRVLRKLSLKDRWLLQSAVGDLSVLNDCDKLETSPIVLGAEAELTFTFEPDAITPTDELVAQQWHIPLVGLPDAWQHLRDANADGVVPGTANDRTFGDANLTIAVIDEGLTSETVGGVLRPAHPDFQGNVSNGQPKVTGFFDFGGMVANNNSPLGAHGTRCSGVATAMAGNASSVAGEEEGVSGAAPNARLLSVQVPSASTEAEFSDIYLWMAGLDPASTTPGFPAVLAQGAAVITNSAGTYNPAAFPVSDLIDATFERITDDGRGGLGTLLFFSAGNDNVQFASARPWANHPRTFGIAASNENDRKAGYSNFGDGIDLCAPSSDAGAGLRSITTTTLPGTGNRTGHTGGPSDYTNGFGGTSSATPFAAGIATLMLSMDPSLTWQEIREILYNTAVKIDFANTDTEGRWRDRDGDGVNEYSNWYGYGRIDAAKAVCAARTRITLNTPTVQFLNVPAGEPTLRAISFSVQSTRNHTFRVINGPVTTIGPANSFVLHNGNEAIHVGNYTCSPSTPRIWVRYVATNVDDIAHGEAIVECVETGQQYTIQFSANVVERPRAALVLALDRSGSMDEFAGDGRRKIQVLRDSAVVVAALAQTDTGLGAVSWDSNADVAGAMPVQDAGFAGIGVGRNALSTHISAHNTNLAGMTAIGDGVLAAQNMLNAAPNAPGGYSVKAVVVLTDGRETESLYLSELPAGTINANVFAIGLGTPENIQPTALAQLTGGNNGYILMTGNIGVDDYFLLTKYYQQILAGITNMQIVVDPEGWLQPGASVRIPFRVNETDWQVDAVLHSPLPDAITYQLETPDGQIIDPGSLAGEPASQFVTDQKSAFYRLSLPVSKVGAQHPQGVWHAILTLDARRFKRYLEKLKDDKTEYRMSQAHGLRYAFVAQARSVLTMQTYLSQTSYEPGAMVQLRVVVTEYSYPAQRGGRVNVVVTSPDGSQTTYPAPETADGIFEMHWVAALSGVYRVHVLGSGMTTLGSRWTREALRSAIVWKGGDTKPPRPSDYERFCQLIGCWQKNGALDAKRLQELGINLTALRRCLCTPARTEQTGPQKG